MEKAPSATDVSTILKSCLPVLASSTTTVLLALTATNPASTVVEGVAVIRGRSDWFS